MAGGSDFLLDVPFRGAIVGYPGSGKTGALAALANAGLKIRVVAFDKKGNMQTLPQYTLPEFRHNIDIVLVEDKLKMGAKTIEVDGQPDAFKRGVNLLDNWEDVKPDGTKYSLGSSKDWGLDTVVVLDTITSMGDAAKRRAKFLLNATNPNDDRVFGAAMGEQEHFIERFMASSNRHHSIVLSHLRIIGPRDTRKGDSEIAQQMKREVADLIPTRLYPSALGWQLPQQIGRHFPNIILAKQKTMMGKDKHFLQLTSDLDLDLRFTGTDLPKELPIETGMVTIFDAVSPGWREAVKAAQVSG